MNDWEAQGKEGRNPESLGPAQLSSARHKLLSTVVGLALVFISFSGVVTSLLDSGETPGLFFTDYEESVEWQMVGEREYPNLKLWMSDVGYGRSVSARYFDCVSPNSPHFETLKISRGHQGLVVDTSCAPLDFSHVSADKLHPELVVQSLFVRRDYIASLPGFTPSGERAVMLRTKWNEYVLINYDTLAHLGLSETESKT